MPLKTFTMITKNEHIKYRQGCEGILGFTDAPGRNVKWYSLLISQNDKHTATIHPNLTPLDIYQEKRKHVSI